jgi:hypothetical protein
MIERLKTWIMGGTLSDKSNKDLLKKAKKIMKQLKKKCNIRFIRIDGHQDEPEDEFMKCYWKGNELVDYLAKSRTGAK